MTKPSTKKSDAATKKRRATTARFVSRTAADGATVVPLPPLDARAGYRDREFEQAVHQDLAWIDARLRELRGA